MTVDVPLEERLRREVRSLLFRNAYVGIAAGCLALVAITIIDWNGAGGAWWVIALFTGLLGRWTAVTMERRQKDNPPELRSNVPLWLYYLFSSFEGLTWAASMFVFFPEQQLNQAFLMIVLAGVGVAGLAVYSGSAFLNGIYAVSISAGVFIKLIGMHGEVYWALAALVPVILSVVLVIAHRMHALFLGLIRVSFQNEQLAQLEAASKRSIIDYSEKLAAKSKEVERVTTRLRKVVTVLSNDLRAQLMTLCELSRLLGEEKRVPPENQFVVTTLQKAAEGGLRLVTDLIQVTGTDASFSQSDLKELRLQQRIEKIMENAQEISETKGL